MLAEAGSLVGATTGLLGAACDFLGDVGDEPVLLTARLMAAIAAALAADGRVAGLEALEGVGPFEGAVDEMHL